MGNLSNLFLGTDDSMPSLVHVHGLFTQVKVLYAFFLIISNINVFPPARL